MRSSVFTLCTLMMLVGASQRTIANSAQDYVVPTVQVSAPDIVPTPVTPDSTPPSTQPTNYVVPTVEEPATVPAAISSEANQTPVTASDPANPPDISADQLGEIRPIQPVARKPDFQVLLRSSVFSTSDVGIPMIIGDRVPAFANQVLLLGTPQIGPQTRLVAVAGGDVVVGGVESYDFINLGVGIRQQIAPGTYAQLGYSYEQLYPFDHSFLNGLSDNSIRLSVVRQDRLAEKLRLNLGYELRASFADPDEQSKVANSLGVRLSYDFTPKFEGALDYRLVIDNLTNPPVGVGSTQIRQQVSTIFTYRFSPDIFLNASLSYLFGSFLNLNGRKDKLNNFNFGIGFGINLY